MSWHDFGLVAGLYMGSTKVNELVVDTERGGTIQINVSDETLFF